MDVRIFSRQRPCWGRKLLWGVRCTKLCIDYESELGIKIVKVRGPFFVIYAKITNDEICKNKDNRIEVSGTKIRNNLINNKEVKEEYMRKEIIKLIRKGDIFIKQI